MSKAPLQYSMQARHRVLAAISWDVRSDKTTIVDRVRGKAQQHDLDLCCFVYDDQGEYIDYIGSMAQDSMDQSGCIYHSGDDATGEGDGDDESISCELAGLPDDVAHMIFVAEIRSAHTFSDIEGPFFRLADGMTDRNLHELSLTGGPATKACVAARIFRDSASSTGWSLHTIGEYPNIGEIPDWGSWLKRYL